MTEIRKYEYAHSIINTPRICDGDLSAFLNWNDSLDIFFSSVDWYSEEEKVTLLKHDLIRSNGRDPLLLEFFANCNDNESFQQHVAKLLPYVISTRSLRNSLMPLAREVIYSFNDGSSVLNDLVTLKSLAAKLAQIYRALRSDKKEFLINAKWVDYAKEMDTLLQEYRLNDRKKYVFETEIMDVDLELVQVINALSTEEKEEYEEKEVLESELRKLTWKKIVPIANTLLKETFMLCQNSASEIKEAKVSALYLKNKHS